MNPNDLLTNEMATREMVMYFQNIGYLPDPDPVLRRQGKDISTYRDILIDSHLSSVIEQRKDEVLCLEWDIDRGKAKSRLAKAVKHMLDRLDIQRIFSEILDYSLWGYQPLEILWETDGKEIYPRDVLGKPQEWFVFSNDNELRLKTRDNWIEGVALPEKKFLLARHKPTYLNPYGDRLLSKVFWPVTFKKGGFKFWLTMTEKYGMPHLLGKIDRNFYEKDKGSVLLMLQNMVQDAVAVIPDSTTIEPLEVNKSVSASIYHELVNFCNSEISKAILTQTLTTELQDGKGAYAASQTHADRLNAVTESDKRIIEKTINQLIKWYCQMNFANEVEAPEFYMFAEEDTDKVTAERDELLTKSGVVFTKKYFMKTYGFEEEDIIVGAAPMGAPAGENIVPSQETEQVLKSLNLNGAQIASATAIVENVSKGDIPRESGINQLIVFLGLTKEQAEAVMGEAGTGKTIKPDKVQGGKTKLPAAPAPDGKKPVVNMQEFKEPLADPEAALSEMVQNIPDKLLQLQIERVLKPVIDLVNNATDYSEVQDKLALLYPDMDNSQLQQLLEKAIFVSEIWGRINNG